jgi:hypothetical protein
MAGRAPTWTEQSSKLAPADAKTRLSSDQALSLRYSRWSGHLIEHAAAELAVAACGLSDLG